MYVIMKLTSSNRSGYSLNKVDSNFTWLGYAELDEAVDWVDTPYIALQTINNMTLYNTLADDYGVITSWNPSYITVHSIYDDKLNDISDQFPEYFI